MAKGGKKKSKPAEKIRLSKEQQKHVKALISTENRVSVCREFIQLWSRFFQFFAEDLHFKEVKPEEEKAFFTTITLLARKHFLFTELMGDYFEGGEDVLKVLFASVSLANIKGMDENTLSKLELDWHTQFLNMNVAMGRLLREMPAGMKLDEKIEQAKSAGQGVKAEAGAAPPNQQKKGVLSRFKKAKA